MHRLNEHRPLQRLVFCYPIAQELETENNSDCKKIKQYILITTVMESVLIINNKQPIVSLGIDWKSRLVAAALMQGIETIEAIGPSGTSSTSTAWP